MKKLIFFLVLFTVCITNSLKSYSTDPKLFVQELVTEAIGKLSNKSLSDEEKFKFIEKIALDNVDINALGLYTLGELRNSTNKEGIVKYQKIFD